MTNEDAIKILQNREDYISLTHGDYGMSLGGDAMVYEDKQLTYAIGKAIRVLGEQKESGENEKQY